VSAANVGLIANDLAPKHCAYAVLDVLNTETKTGPPTYTHARADT